MAHAPWISRSAPLLVIAACVAATSWAAQVWADVYADPGGVPRLVPFRGHLESGGVAVTTTVAIEVRVFDAPTGGALLWGPESHSVTPAGGDFTLMLGSNVALPAAALEGGDAWVALSVEGTALSGRQRLASVPYALRTREAANGLPIGSVVPWWRPTAATPVPEGFAVCDGSMVSDPDSPLDGTVLPDLRERVILGVPLDRSGETAGTPGTVWSTDAAGAHAHTWVTRAGLSWISGDGRTIITWGDGFGTDGTGHYAVATATASGTVVYNTSTAPSHVHSVSPPYVGLVMLMRTR
jgi:hypothetical protein